MNKELKEFFENNPGKTLADYYQQRGTDTLTNKRKSESNSNSWEDKSTSVHRSPERHDRTYYQEAEMGLNNSAKTQLILSSVGIICFFLPWFSVSTPFNGLSLTAVDLVSGKDGTLMLLFFPIAFLINALIIIYKKQELLILRNIVFIIPFVYILVKVYQVVDMAGGLNNASIVVEFISTFTSSLGGTASFGIGIYGTFLCLVLILLFPSGIGGRKY